MTTNPIPTVLTIAGSDCSAGAGIQTDLKTIHALGGYALTVPTAITIQNSQGVQAVYPLEVKQVAEQLDCLFADYEIAAIKIGMVANSEILNSITERLEQHPDIQVILDPIVLSSSGKTLLEKPTLHNMASTLFPLCTLITPNIPELEYLLKHTFDCDITLQEMNIDAVAQTLSQLGCPNTLLKGGHSHENQATDYLFTVSKDENKVRGKIHIEKFSSSRIPVQHNHGTGCTLSSAIATGLAKGQPLNQAVKKAKEYLFKVLQQSDAHQPHYKTLNLKSQSNRHGGLHHFIDLPKK